MRRPIASRDSNWAHRTAKVLARTGATPNFISTMSVVVAALAGACLFETSQVESRWVQVVLFLSGAVFIQLRLLCNLLDGMLAVEFKKGSVMGPIWNDFPDRLADGFILVGCGFSGGPAWMPTLGWLATSLALLTAYTRVLGAAVGGGEYFIGPMAKPHRMATATIASVLAALEALLLWPHRVMVAALILIILGCLWTTQRRLKLIARGLTDGAPLP